MGNGRARALRIAAVGTAALLVVSACSAEPDLSTGPSAIQDDDRTEVPATESPSALPKLPVTWSGPIRADYVGMAALPQFAGSYRGFRDKWPEERGDTDKPWVDITNVYIVQARFGGRLSFQLEGLPASPDASVNVIAYGVTVDLDRDGEADWILGMDNQVPTGQHRAWLTELATGTTEQKVGPPYGDPFDSWYPGETRGTIGIFTLDMVGQEHRETVQLYAWAVMTDSGGEVLAWDYAPDTAWLGRD